MKTAGINNRKMDNTVLGFVCGAIGGVIKLLTSVEPYHWSHIVQAAITAIICGAAGVAGKELYYFIKKYFRK